MIQVDLILCLFVEDTQLLFSSKILEQKALLGIK